MLRWNEPTWGPLHGQRRLALHPGGSSVLSWRFANDIFSFTGEVCHLLMGEVVVAAAAPSLTRPIRERSKVKRRRALRQEREEQQRQKPRQALGRLPPLT